MRDARALAYAMRDALSPADWNLRGRLRRIGWLKSHYYLLLAIGLAWRDGTQGAQQELNEAFAREDPWDYAGPLERNRHAAELRMLDGVNRSGGFRSALELGCAEGAFTELLSDKCRNLLAVDLCSTALARARTRCGAKPNVRFEQWDLRQWPERPAERHDLIVAVHVLEYIRSPRALRRIRSQLVESLDMGGHLLLGNVFQGSMSETTWWGKYFLHGGNWINRFVADDPRLKVVATGELDLVGCQSRDMLLRRIA
jgi:SAM-dependent methyltransferase